MSWLTPVNSVRVYTTNPKESTKKLAIFDLDWTLIRPIYGNFPKCPRDAFDFEILPGRYESLKYLIDNGYTIVVLTNQGWKTQQQIQICMDRIQKFVETLNLPITIFVALGQDEYRKPQPGMWKLIQSMLSPVSDEAFYIGDAAGRSTPKDFDDADLQWAKNVGIPFATPEDFFPRIIPEIPEGKILAVLVGCPGSGKSTFYEQYLKPKGYIHVSQDIYKTKEKTYKMADLGLQSGKPVAIDNTNGSQDKRQLYYDLAKKYGYSVVVYYLVRNGESWNGCREKHVPPVAYGTYYRDFVLPTPENTPGPIYQIW